MRQVFDGKLGERVRIESGDFYNQKTGVVALKVPLSADVFYHVELDEPIEVAGRMVPGALFAPSELQIIV